MRQQIIRQTPFFWSSIRLYHLRDSFRPQCKYSFLAIFTEDPAIFLSTGLKKIRYGNTSCKPEQSFMGKG
jgi:hypothetical protein